WNAFRTLTPEASELVAGGGAKRNPRNESTSRAQRPGGGVRSGRSFSHPSRANRFAGHWFRWLRSRSSLHRPATILRPSGTPALTRSLRAIQSADYALAASLETDSEP